MTLSRDLRELHLVKTRAGYQEMAVEDTDPQFAYIAAEFLKDVARAQNQLVIKTSAGYANSVAVALDGEHWREIIGTVSGHDTILVICADVPTAEIVLERLVGLMNIEVFLGQRRLAMTDGRCRGGSESAGTALRTTPPKLLNVAHAASDGRSIKLTI